FIETLRDCGALRSVLPEVDALYGVPGPRRWHPEIDSGVHTCLTIARVSAETEDPVTRFAMLCHDLGKGRTPVTEWPHHRLHHLLGVQPLREMCLRLKVPKEYENFAFRVVRYHSEMHHVYRGGPEGLVTLFDELDAWRNPSIVKPWVLCCKCDFLGRLGFSNRPFPRADYVLGLFALLRNVRAEEFVKAGFKGPEIREQMRRKRIALASDYLKTLPKSELDDSANEMPPDGDINWRPFGKRF
ncbi:MAG: HD domain-containing protein, partial [Succinivibrio sp.]